MSQMSVKYVCTPFGRKIDNMDIKNTNIFHRKALQNLPKFGFLVWKQTIWHGNPGTKLSSSDENMFLPVVSTSLR
jgi:hypothetical protein